MAYSDPGVAAATADMPLGPVTGKERIIALDVVRGVALFGILMMNIYGFAWFGSITEFIDQPLAGANWWSWFIMNTAFEGTQRTLFSLLFGAGVILLTSRVEQRGGGLSIADIYYRRSIWLILFGMAHSYVLLWDGDILYYYGVVALFLFPLRSMKPSHLVGMSLAALVIMMALSIHDTNENLQLYDDQLAAQAIVDAGEEVDEEQQEALDEWKEKIEDYFPSDEKRAEALEAMHGSYVDIWKHKLDDIIEGHTRWLYRALFLDGFSVMVLGMALMKWGVLTLQRSTRFYWLMTIIGLGIGWPVSYWESMIVVNANYTLVSTFMNDWTYDIGRIANATGYLGLLLLFVRSGWLGWLQTGLAAVGRMALTNYLMHSLLCAIVFYGIGFALYGMIERYEMYYVVLAIWILQLIVSPIWLKYFRFGPAEWLWRSLTYMKKQPMSRAM